MSLATQPERQGSSLSHDSPGGAGKRAAAALADPWRRPDPRADPRPFAAAIAAAIAIAVAIADAESISESDAHGVAWAVAAAWDAWDAVSL